MNGILIRDAAPIGILIDREVSKHDAALCRHVVRNECALLARRVQGRFNQSCVSSPSAGLAYLPTLPTSPT